MDVVLAFAEGADPQMVFEKFASFTDQFAPTLFALGRDEAPKFPFAAAILFFDRSERRQFSQILKHLISSKQRDSLALETTVLFCVSDALQCVPAAEVIKGCEQCKAAAFDIETTNIVQQLVKKFHLDSNQEPGLSNLSNLPFLQISLNSESLCPRTPHLSVKMQKQSSYQRLEPKVESDTAVKHFKNVGSTYASSTKKLIQDVEGGQQLDSQLFNSISRLSPPSIEQTMQKFALLTHKPLTHNMQPLIINLKYCGQQLFLKCGFGEDPFALTCQAAKIYNLQDYCLPKLAAYIHTKMQANGYLLDATNYSENFAGSDIYKPLQVSAQIKINFGSISLVYDVKIGHERQLAENIVYDLHLNNEYVKYLEEQIIKI